MESTKNMKKGNANANRPTTDKRSVEICQREAVGGTGQSSVHNNKAAGCQEEDSIEGYAWLWTQLSFSYCNCTDPPLRRHLLASASNAVRRHITVHGGLLGPRVPSNTILVFSSMR